MKKLLALLLLAPCLAAAQITKSANATASVSTITALTLTKTTDLSFGSFVPSGSQVAPTAAAWNGNATPGSLTSVTFTLPASLTAVAPATGSVAISYGTGSATYCSGTGCTPATAGATAFNPATGLGSTPVSGNGDFAVYLCTSPTTGSLGACSVNLNGAPAPATFTGTITLTVVR